MPNLLELSSRIDAKFTFFVNMGRAVSRSHAIRRRLRGHRGQGGGPEQRPPSAAKLSPALKLGAWDLLLAATLNPRVGAGSPRVLRDALADDHEIGLHGGVNHATWQAEARDWTPSRLREEVRHSLQRLESVTGQRPRGFASPGWTTSEHLPPLLEQLGFQYLADAHGPDHPPIRTPPGSTGLLSVRTDLCGEPGGVAYLEHLRALGLDDSGIKDDFRSRLLAADRLVVAYDHPYYAGIRELDMIHDLVAIARELGFQVVTLGQAVRSLSSEPD